MIESIIGPALSALLGFAKQDQEHERAMQAADPEGYAARCNAITEHRYTGVPTFYMQQGHLVTRDGVRIMDKLHKQAIEGSADEIAEEYLRDRKFGAPRWR